MTDPRLLDLVAAVRRDPVNAGPLCDWLDERGVGLAEVLRLYALPPETPRECVRCRRVMHRRSAYTTVHYVCDECGVLDVEPAQASAPEDDSLRPVLVEWLRRQGDARAGQVRDPYLVSLEAFSRGGGTVWQVSSHRTALWGGPHYSSEPAARRALKRAVLGLFAEVRVPCPECKGTRGVGDGQTRTICPLCNSGGTFAPADLIPPEPSVRIQFARVGDA